MSELLGTRMEITILHAKIMTGKPEACSSIGQALNKRQAVVVDTVDTTTIATLSRQITATKDVFAVADENRFQMVKATLGRKLDILVIHELTLPGLFQINTSWTLPAMKART